MFKRSKVKIVAVIMVFSFVLIAGMLGIIYTISYQDMHRSHQDMLARYIEDYNRPKEEMPNPGMHGFHKMEPMGKPELRFELSTFYSVWYDKNGTVRGVDNNGGAIYTEEEIAALAEKILEKGDSSGVYEEFSYVVKPTPEGSLVVFIDNTIETENFMTIIKYTLVFAGITLVVVFLLSCYFAGKIVRPLEQSALKQKQFISDAGHELKTPIAVLSTNLEMLHRQIGENKWLNNMEYETEKMSALVKQLMELAKTESVTPFMEVLDLSHLVEGEILPFESVAFEQGVLLNYEGIKPSLTLRGNAEQLKQLVSILTDNAIEHAMEAGEVIIRLEDKKNKAVLSVANKGEEIPMEQRAHLFERFYRGEYARNRESNHYGLGLAIAKAIAEGHKGNIKVDCENGYVIFEVQLPIN